MTTEEEEAARRAAEEQKDRTAALPERLTFRGAREELALLYMKSGNAEGIRERIESAMRFISTVSDMLVDEEDDEAQKDAKSLHDFVTKYRQPKNRHIVEKTRDGILVLVVEEPGPEKGRQQFLPGDYRGPRDKEDQMLAEHFITGIIPWFTASRQIAIKRGYLRPEGEKLTSRKTLMTRQSLVRESLAQRKREEFESEDEPESEGDGEEQ